MIITEMPSDEELIREAQKGALDGFTLLYERYFPLVYNRVKYVIPEEDIEDVTQEIFIAVVRSLGSFRHEARFSTWLRTLVNRHVADYYRGRRPMTLSLSEPGDEADEEYVHPMPSMSDDHERVDDRIVVRAALQKLPDHYREIILLRFGEGLSFDEIAQQQRQSLEATKSLFRRAIASLTTQIKDG